jgi:hypothetical protein
MSIPEGRLLPDDSATGPSFVESSATEAATEVPGLDVASGYFIEAE